ncbi:MAG: hypothetical protein K6E97_03955 [Treponema sp.]|nr:hypothetical protein [Treponema sp.]
MAEIKFEYHSVKDVLPVDDGKFYDVMVILYGTSIEGGYNYYRGKYQNGFFFIDKGIYQKKNDFICSWTQDRVIAWKPLETVSKEQLNEFCIKAGVK